MNVLSKAASTSGKQLFHARLTPAACAVPAASTSITPQVSSFFMAPSMEFDTDGHLDEKRSRNPFMPLPPPDPYPLPGSCRVLRTTIPGRAPGLRTPDGLRPTRPAYTTPLSSQGSFSRA